MTTLLKQTFFALTLIAVLIVPQHSVFCAETYTVGAVTGTPTFRFNNDNWFTEDHPQIASFSMNDDGSAFGLTVTGVPFTQYNVPNTAGIRIQRFEIEDHYHYIVEGEIVYSMTELSAHLAQAYLQQTNSV